MKSFKEFLEEEKVKNLDIKQVEEISNKGAFVTLTAFRGTINKETGKPFYSKSDNQKRNSKLESDIKTKGYKYIEVDGVFVEGHGTDNARVVKESTFLVWVDIIEKANKLKSDMIKLGEKYDQDAILYKTASSKQAMLIGTNDKDENGDPITFPSKGKRINVGKFKAGAKGEFYTRLKNGQTFAFK